jgi:hypothetical protein
LFLLVLNGLNLLQMKKSQLPQRNETLLGWRTLHVSRQIELETAARLLCVLFALPASVELVLVRL